MEKKGTGWIPDYPDLNDYTLQSDAINNLANQIQSQGATTSIDNLAQKVYKALGILVEKNDNDNKDLKKIREELNKEILGDPSFVTAKFHNVFKEGVADSEVFLIKNYLKTIFSQLLIETEHRSSTFLPDHSITDFHFDSLTSKAVQVVQEAISINSTQKQREADGFVDNYDLRILKLLADPFNENLDEDVLKKNDKVGEKNRGTDDKKISMAIFLPAIADKLEAIFKEKIEPIASPINQVSQLVKKKLLEPEEAIIKSILFAEAEENQQQLIQNLQKLISPLSEVIVQMLMPLGQHSNLSKGVDREIKKAQYLVEAKKDNQEESKKLIREIIDAYKLSSVINLDARDNFDFQEVIFETIEELKNELERNKLLKIFKQLCERKIEDIDNSLSKIIQEEHFNETEKKYIESIKEEIKQLINTPLYFLIKGYLKRNKSEQNKKKKSGQTKKQLFEISLSELGINESDSSSSSADMPLQQMRNRLVFPINSSLREKLLVKQNNERKNDSISLEDKKLDKKKLPLLPIRKNHEDKIFLSLPEYVDLTYWCSPVEDQGSLNSCTAHAGIALMEYAEKKSSGTYIDGSPRFLYKVTRNLIQREGDSGASVRDTMKAMVAFGVCPEQYWLYDEDKYDEEPTPFCYSFAENYKTLKYFRLDYAAISRYTLLAQVKVLLVSEIPCIFGFTLYNSVYDEFNVQRGHIPLPHQRDKVIGGHTVVAVGYHDRKVIENADGDRSEGALLIRNSWGTRWGQGGYGWLPYDYVIQGLTADWWSLLKADWLATGRFGAGASAWNSDKGGGQNGNQGVKQPGSGAGASAGKPDKGGGKNGNPGGKQPGSGAGASAGKPDKGGGKNGNPGGKQPGS